MLEKRFPVGKLRSSYAYTRTCPSNPFPQFCNRNFTYTQPSVDVVSQKRNLVRFPDGSKRSVPHTQCFSLQTRKARGGGEKDQLAQTNLKMCGEKIQRNSVCIWLGFNVVVFWMIFF